MAGGEKEKTEALLRKTGSLRGASKGKSKPTVPTVLLKSLPQSRWSSCFRRWVRTFPWWLERSGKIKIKQANHQHRLPIAPFCFALPFSPLSGCAVLISPFAGLDTL